MTIRTLSLALACAAAILPGTATADEAKAKTYWVYFGTYTGAKSKGIYMSEMDAETGKLSAPQLVAEMPSPSFLAIHPNRKYLYAVAEVDKVGDKKGGAVKAFSIDAKTGKLTLLNTETSGGGGPCHLVVDRAGKNVLVANYGGGSVEVLPIEKDGKLGEPSTFIQHKGSSVDKGRQEGPHAHSINVDKNNRFAIAADLGLDQLLVYKFNADKGTLTANDPAFHSVAPGSGPRHFAFHPTAPAAYVINEMANTLDSLSYDSEKGSFKKLQSLPTLPLGFKGNNSTAEVVVHPSGKFVYGSNRGHNSIVAFAADPKTGELKYVAHQSKGIKTPRNFAIDPSGTFMLVANQDGGNVLVFRIDEKTGELKPTEEKAEVASPVCVRFMAKP